MPDFVTVDDINVFVGEVIHCGLANVTDDGEHETKYICNTKGTLHQKRRQGGIQ